MEKQDEKLRNLEAELTGMEAVDAVVTAVDAEAEQPVKRCVEKA